MLSMTIAFGSRPKTLLHSTSLLEVALRVGTFFRAVFTSTWSIPIPFSYAECHVLVCGIGARKDRSGL